MRRWLGAGLTLTTGAKRRKVGPARGQDNKRQRKTDKIRWAEIRSDWSRREMIGSREGGGQQGGVKSYRGRRCP